MPHFLLDDANSYTYADLLNTINAKNDYYPLLKTKDLYSFFANLVKALINNVPITLLDSDLSIDEIEKLNESQINLKSELPAQTFTSMDEVVKKIQKSTSDIVIFTSGTTGQPKSVKHSITTLTRSVRTGENYYNHVWAFAYNPTHMAGLQVFFQAFINQNMLINVFNHSRSEIYTLIDKYNISHISGTPTFYRLLLPFEFTHISVQRITLGGEKSDGYLYDSIKKIFPQARINNVYASTEAGSLFASKGDCFEIPQNIYDKFQVIDDELLIHRSLLGSSDSFQFDDDFYHSGDLIEWVDKKLRLFKFKSRKNELINVGGYKINPEEVEFVINAIEGVCQSLVYGRPNSVLGNVLCAEVQLEQGALLTELEIRMELKQKLQDFKIPRKIKFVNTFALTRTGKLKRI